MGKSKILKLQNSYVNPFHNINFLHISEKHADKYPKYIEDLCKKNEIDLYQDK